METVNINTATATDLQKIKGIGKVRSQKIIENRPFRDRYELSKIAGLGEIRMNAILQQNILIQY
jgi:DNA uptake protein ComE-like DNA-binding protein